VENFYFFQVEGLQMLVNYGFIPDPSILRITGRPMIPRSEDLITCPFPSSDKEKNVLLRCKPSSVVENRRSALLYRIGKLWTIAELQLAYSIGNISHEVISEVCKELDVCEEEVAVNSDSIATDATLIQENAVVENKK